MPTKIQFDTERWLRSNAELYRRKGNLQMARNFEMCAEDVKALLARAERLEESLPDPHKLEILAAWFDLNFKDDRNPEVQNDLREWAKKIRRALEEK